MTTRPDGPRSADYRKTDVLRSRAALPAYRRLVVTCVGEESAHYAGYGVTLDEVLARETEGRDLEALGDDGWNDLCIWEADRIAAVVLLRPGGPFVHRFDGGPAPAAAGPDAGAPDDEPSDDGPGPPAINPEVADAAAALGRAVDDLIALDERYERATAAGPEAADEFEAKHWDPAVAVARCAEARFLGAARAVGVRAVQVGGRIYIDPTATVTPDHELYPESAWIIERATVAGLGG